MIQGVLLLTRMIPLVLEMADVDDHAILTGAGY